MIISKDFNLKNNFTRSTLITYFKNLNYGGRLFLYSISLNSESIQQLEQILLICGFTNITSKYVTHLEYKIGEECIKYAFEIDNVICIKSEKPDFKVNLFLSIFYFFIFVLYNNYVIIFEDWFIQRYIIT